MPPWQSARALFLVGVQHSDDGECRCVPIADDKIGLWPAKRVARSELGGYVELAPSGDSGGCRNTMDFRKGLLWDTNTQESPGTVNSFAHF